MGRDVPMENDLIKSGAKKLACCLNRYANKEGLELKKLELGMEFFLINVSKLIIIYTLAALFGVVNQTIVVHFAFIVIKRYSFGLHALNSTVCSAVSCFLFVIVPFLLNSAGIGNHIVFPVFIAIVYILYRYAPADTKARPLVGIELRARLRAKAVISGVVLMILTLFVPNESTKLLLVMGAVYQCASILPLTYRLLKRSERNYETYESI